MDSLETLRRYGLFDAKVPRYTSYPPANRFAVGVGQRYQASWLHDTPKTDPVSIYVHIPFCRRLCWFCACRTQGTRTLGPVDAYIDAVISEIEAVAARVSHRPPMARLHLGGGTPTLLRPEQMDRLLDAVFARFTAAPDFAFSVEIDPTEAAPEIVDKLLARGMTRASIGVQDFDPLVQEAIGRRQSYAQTEAVVTALRDGGITSINFDLLYGLPHQTERRLLATLDQALDMAPERIALYGYAHVPHVSKRQVMIDAARLPSAEARYHMAEAAALKLAHHGYIKLGIDHFSKPADSLLHAAERGELRRNFQGYTDDTCATLIGFGASAISKFPQGYSQNAVSTAAYLARITETGLAGHKGYAMQGTDHKVARMIEMLMCGFAIDPEALLAEGLDDGSVPGDLDAIAKQFPDLFTRIGSTLCLPRPYHPLTRIIAASLDALGVEQNHHSLAV